MEDVRDVFIGDIPGLEHGQLVAITGICTEKKRFTKVTLGAWIKDITGKILCNIDIESTTDLYKKEDVRVDARLRVTGELAVNHAGKTVISGVRRIEVLGTLKTNLSDLAELDSDMKEQASRMLMSQFCRRASSYLNAKNFIEFESRVVSNRRKEDGLEPLLVLYPGFGSPVTLATSPAAQVVEFLTITLARRAFTISTSFASSYRSPNAPTEMRVIVGKSIDMSLDEQESLILEVCVKTLRGYGLEGKSVSRLHGSWPSQIEGKTYSDYELPSDLNLITFSADLPVVGGSWITTIDKIIQIMDQDMNILAEGSRERLSNGAEIAGFTVYPSQLLGLVEKAPRRQLQNLERPFDER